MIIIDDLLKYNFTNTDIAILMFYVGIGLFGIWGYYDTRRFLRKIKSQ